ncbi:MAG: hypothetical protein WKH47_00850 [Actinomycetes bacterium]
MAKRQSNEVPSEAWLTHHVQELFADPRFKHVRNLASDDEPIMGDTTDPERMMAGVMALYNIISAEKTGRALTRATWVLAFATVGLVIATIVLVVVTIQG